MEKITATFSVEINEKAIIEMRDAYNKCPKAQLFLKKNGVPDDVIERNISKVFSFVRDINYCTNCPGLDDCLKEDAHLCTKLIYSDGFKDFIKRDGFTIEDIASFKDYSIVDLERPKMCADRLNNVMTVGMGWIGSLDFDVEYLKLLPVNFKNIDKFKPALKKYFDFVSKNNPLWIRHVVVPGLTDSPEEVMQISALAHRYRNLQKVELLPFHKMCIPKYEALGIPFRLKDYEACSKETIEHLYKYI